MWRCRSGNFLEHTPRLAAVFEGLEAEFDFSGTASKVARAFNTEAKGRLKKLKLPLGATTWEFGAQELRGTPASSPTGARPTPMSRAVGDDGGPSEAEIMKALAIADIIEAAIAEAMKEANERASRAIESRPANRIEYSTGKIATTVPDDDIPF